jgi:hypothetical protein
MEKVILNEIDHLLTLDFGEGQKKYFQYLKDQYKEVRVAPLNEVFTVKEIHLIKKVVKPQLKQCFRNAAKLVELFPDRVKYVEGKFMKYFPMEHAFNLVDGDKYVDLTFELVLKDEEVATYEYASFLELNYEQQIDLMLSTGMYGDWIIESYKNRISNN